VSVSTPVFVAGVGVLVSLDLAVLGISVQNARKLGKDPVARKKAQEAKQAAVRVDGNGSADD